MVSSLFFYMSPYSVNWLVWLNAHLLIKIVFNTKRKENGESTMGEGIYHPPTTSQSSHHFSGTRVYFLNVIILLVLWKVNGGKKQHYYY